MKSLTADDSMRFHVTRETPDVHFRYGMATLKDGTRVERCRRKKQLLSYLYFNPQGRNITEEVIAFRCDEFIATDEHGNDHQQ